MDKPKQILEPLTLDEVAAEIVAAIEASDLPATTTIVRDGWAIFIVRRNKWDSTL